MTQRRREGVWWRGWGKGGGVPDKLLSLIPFVCVNGCDCVTFAASNPAPSFLLIMQKPIRIRGDTCHQQRFSNKWSPCRFAKLAEAPRWYLSGENKTAQREGKTERLIETTGVFQEPIKTFISLRKLDFGDDVESLQRIFWDGPSGKGQDLTWSLGSVYFWLTGFRTNETAVLRGIIKRLYWLRTALKSEWRF